MASYPLTSYHFQVVWGGANVSFQEVTGLNMNRDKIPYRGGASPIYSDTVMPGRPTFDDIVMKRGIFKGDDDYLKWYETIVLNEVERRDLTISLLGPDHQPVVTWKVKNAFPLKIEGPGLKANANEVAIEGITISHEGITHEHNS